MGIVYNTKIGRGYINTQSCHRQTSYHRNVNALTRRNIQFLKSLGLNVVKNIAKRQKHR